MLVEPHNPEWRDRYAAESARLTDLLGVLVDGGIVDSIAHVGSTAVPGLPGRPCIDIALSVWPLPLSETAQCQLVTLGYQLSDKPEAISNPLAERRFLREDGRFQLFISHPGDSVWHNHLLVRDFLRASKDARQKHITGIANDHKQAILAQLQIDALAAWKQNIDFEPVRSVAAELRNAPIDWCISSGWALDLFAGRVTRYHHDVDVVIARADQLALQRYLTERGWNFLTPLSGKLELWPAHMHIALPRHQVHAHRDVPPHEVKFIDFLLSEIDDDLWRYRKRPEIMRTRKRMTLATDDGIPFLAPELNLLHKSQNTAVPPKPRPQDNADFETVYGQMDAERRAWLRWALTVTAPGHEWIARLA